MRRRPANPWLPVIVAVLATSGLVPSAIDAQAPKDEVRARVEAMPDTASIRAFIASTPNTLAFTADYSSS